MWILDVDRFGLPQDVGVRRSLRGGHRAGSAGYSDAASGFLLPAGGPVRRPAQEGLLPGGPWPFPALVSSNIGNSGTEILPVLPGPLGNLFVPKRRFEIHRGSSFTERCFEPNDGPIFVHSKRNHEPKQRNHSSRGFI